jgi:hypothetical protein
MSPRFALRWSLIGLACAGVLVAAAWLLSRLQPAPATQAPQSVSVDALLAAAEMPLDANGVGTQIISGTTFTLRLAPYPARASQTATVTLVALAANGIPAVNVNPALTIAQTGRADVREFAMLALPDHSYQAAGVLFPQPGAWRVRVDVYVGDPTPANILLTVNTQ